MKSTGKVDIDEPTPPLSFISILERHRVGNKKMLLPFLERAHAMLTEGAKREQIRATEDGSRVAAFAYICELIRVCYRLLRQALV